MSFNLNNIKDKKKFYELIDQNIKTETDKIKINVTYKYLTEYNFIINVNYKSMQDKNDFNYFNDAKMLNGFRIKISSNEKLFEVNCLDLWIFKNRKNEYKFGYIESINKGICGLNKNYELKELFQGSFVLKLAETIFDIFGVEISYLVDDSRLNYKFENYDKKFNYKFYMELKYAGFFKYEKTWYEKASGYKMVNDDFYKYGKIIKNIKLNTLINVIKKHEKDQKYLKYYNREDVLNKLKIILGKMNKKLDKVTIGKIYSYLFNKNINLEQEEITFLLDYISMDNIDGLTDLYDKYMDLNKIYPKNITKEEKEYILVFSYFSFFSFGEIPRLSKKIHNKKTPNKIPSKIKSLKKNKDLTNQEKILKARRDAIKRLKKYKKNNN